MSLVRRNTSALRREIEDGLAERAPHALSPRVRNEPERLACGVRALDELLHGGLPVGAIAELVGAECSGRTTVAQAYAAAAIQNGNVAAWVDVDDVFDPECATRGGVDCQSLLWVRCGGASRARAGAPGAACAPAQGFAVTRTSQPVPVGGGGSPHPRSEGRAMPRAIEALLAAQPRYSALPPRRRDKSIGTPGAPNRPLPTASIDREEQIPTDRLPPRRGERVLQTAQATRRTEPRDCSRRDELGSLMPVRPAQSAPAKQDRKRGKQSWAPLDQALRATDLLLQSGGFGLIVLDLGSTPAEKSWRVPLASWFRFRAACDRTRAILLLLTRHPCARSSAELVVRMNTGAMQAAGGVLTAVNYHAEVERQRFQRSLSNVVPIRKPPQSERPGTWRAQTTWAL